MFRRLSVFVGGFTLESAEAVCGGEESARLGVGGALSGLVNKSMVSHRDASGEPRLTMLEVIREYGLERLEASGEADATYRRHARFFCSLAERNERPKVSGETLAGMLAVLEREISNLRAGMGWARDNGERETVLRAAGSMRLFWALRGFHEEGWQWLSTSLSAEGPVPDSVRARALVTAGRLDSHRGDYNCAIALAEEGLALWRGLGTQDRVADALRMLGEIWLSQGSAEQALNLLEEGLGISREQSDPWTIADLLNDIGAAHTIEREHGESLASLTEALELFRKLGDRWRSAMVLNNLALALAGQDRYEEALERVEESVVVQWQAGNLLGLLNCLDTWALLACTLGNYEAAAPVLGFMAAWREASGTPRLLCDQPEYECALKAARARLEPSVFEAAWANGRSRTVEETMNYVQTQASNVHKGSSA